MKTRSQKYAAKIFEQVKVYKDKKDKEAQEGRRGASDEIKKYGRMAHKLPILVKKAGLVQAIEFVSTRREPACDGLLEHIAKVMKYEDGKELKEAICKAEIAEYIHLTQRVLDALYWYKSFSQSILKVEGGEN